MMAFAEALGLNWEMIVGFVAKHSPAAVVHLDKYEIVYATPGFHRIFGYSYGELAGCSLEQLIPRELRERHRSAVDDYSIHPQPRNMGQGQRLNLVGLKRDGTSVRVSVQLSETEAFGKERARLLVAVVVERTEEPIA